MASHVGTLRPSILNGGQEPLIQTLSTTSVPDEPAPLPPDGSPKEERPALEPDDGDRIGVVLTGGGARAAYQVGILRYLAQLHPHFRFSILTGVSAGAINATFLAGHQGTPAEAVDELSRVWLGLRPERVFRVDSGALAKGMLRWVLRLVSGGSALAPQVRGLVDTSPLDALLRRVLGETDGALPGIARNLDAGRLRALALSSVDYATGRTVTWVQGHEVPTWHRTHRHSQPAKISVQHVMASAALPLLFPAVYIDGSWHGDGGIRLAAPLSPALHLGAQRILAISTRYQPSSREIPEPEVARSYPPPVQVAGVLLNAIFLDALDQDARRLRLVNRMLESLPPDSWGGLRPVKLLLLRPSQNLGRLAGKFEFRLPFLFRFLTRGLGTRETPSPDILSMLLFQRDYVTRLIEIGEADAAKKRRQIERLLEP